MDHHQINIFHGNRRRQKKLQYISARMKWLNRNAEFVGKVRQWTAFDAMETFANKYTIKWQRDSMVVRIQTRQFGDSANGCNSFQHHKSSCAFSKLTCQPYRSITTRMLRTHELRSEHVYIFCSSFIFLPSLTLSLSNSCCVQVTPDDDIDKKWCSNSFSPPR